MTVKYPTVHIKDRHVVNLLDPNRFDCWMAGGSVRAWYEDRPVERGSDIDFFFKNRRSFEMMKSSIERIETKTVAHTFGDFLESFNMVKKESVKLDDYYLSTVSKTDNAITYNLEYKKQDNYRIQLIYKNFFDSPQETVDKFDITVCQIATDGHTFWVGKHFVEDLRNRRLRFANHQPDILKRLLKYWVYGFEPDLETLELIRQSNELETQFNNDGDYNNAF